MCYDCSFLFWGDYNRAIQQREGENKAMLPFKLGSKVRVKSTGEVLEVRESITTKKYVLYDQGTETYHGMFYQSELAEVEVTPEEAWERVRIYVGQRSVKNSTASEQKETRRQCYILLSGASVNIVPSVKEEVRRIMTIAEEVLKNG